MPGWCVGSTITATLPSNSSLIGSARKWDRFRKRLAQRGFTEQEIAKVRCPIGVSKHSKEPAAIAISVAAELLEVLQGETAR